MSLARMDASESQVQLEVEVLYLTGILQTHGSVSPEHFAEARELAAVKRSRIILRSQMRVKKHL